MTILYRIEPNQNMRRFYRLDIQQDLFGKWTVTREWGRIGRPGQMKMESFKSEEKAATNLRDQLCRKSKRGYVESHA